MSLHIPITNISSEQDISVLVDDFCNHYGAEMATVIAERFDEDSGRNVPDDTFATFVCRCGMQLAPNDDGGEWV